jgi:hypothetical protein
MQQRLHQSKKRRRRGECCSSLPMRKGEEEGGLDDSATGGVVNDAYRRQRHARRSGRMGEWSGRERSRACGLRWWLAAGPVVLGRP